MPTTDIKPETIPASDTTISLPTVISNFVAGDESNVSSEPLSFSPAPKSIAGYIAPRKIKMTSIYGTNPPRALPMVSFFVDMSFVTISSGSKSALSILKRDNLSETTFFL